MSSAKPCIGCRIGLISKAQNRYEGILYTIDKVNSTVVLAKVKCFGTEGRPTDRPTPPRDDVYDYITFRGGDIQDIALCEHPRPHHGLPPDPAIIQSSSAGSSGSSMGRPPFSPLRMHNFSQLAAGSLLNQQCAAALGIGHLVPGFHVRRGPMVEKAVQTLVENSGQRSSVSWEQEQQWERRTSREGVQTRAATGDPVRSSLGKHRPQQETQQDKENRPPPKRKQARRRRNRRKGQLMVTNLPTAILTFDTDFDFDLSNAQFIKEELEREVQERMNEKDGIHKMEEEGNDHFLSPGEDDHFGPKCYYDKAKSFYDNISSDKKFRLTWAEERKRNLETFGLPGRFVRGQSFRGGYTGRRGQGPVQPMSSSRARAGQQDQT